MTEEKYISLLVTSDIHGYIYPTNYSDHVEQNFGLAKLSTLIEQKRKETNVILLDNGDLIQGSPLTFYHAKYQKEAENPLIKVVNHLGYTASVFGNHEFNYGLPYLRHVVQKSNFPWLSASVLNGKTEEPAFGQPYVIKKIEDITIAILGVTTHYIPNWEDPKNIQGLAFKDALAATNDWVKYIREQKEPDVLIVSYHGGFERDLETGDPTEELTGENQGYQICQEVQGIDILVTGHQHRTIADKINGVAVVQPSNYGQLLGEVELQLVKGSSKWNLVNTVSRVHATSEDMEPDKRVLELVASYEASTQDWLDRPIGSIDGDMSIEDPFQLRLKDHPFIEFINKVQMDSAGVDLSNTSLFNNASKGFSDEITMRDVVANYIYPNTLKVIEISGKDIKEALEQSATYFTVKKEGEIGVNPAFVDPKPQHYNYDMWEGIEYVLDISKPIGERVVKLNYKGKLISLERKFQVVMNNYRAGGGGNYYMYQGKPVIKDIQTDMTELIATYILKQEKLKATCNKNWYVTF